MSTKTSMQIRCFNFKDIVRDDSAVHRDFKDQLKRIKDDWCRTRLMWKDNFISLENNKLCTLGKIKEFAAS